MNKANLEVLLTEEEKAPAPSRTLIGEESLDYGTRMTLEDELNKLIRGAEE